MSVSTVFTGFSSNKPTHYLIDYDDFYDYLVGKSISKIAVFGKHTQGRLTEVIATIISR